jgi:hypothetical protein
MYFQDTWRLHRGLTLNYGLGWNVDRNLNYDLRKPGFLAPILGANGLGASRKNWKDFTPVLGLAWAPSPDGKTVLRAGAALFYDFLTSPSLDPERALLGPPGLGRQTFSGNSLVNCLVGIPGVPPGTALNFPNTPTRLTELSAGHSRRPDSDLGELGPVLASRPGEQVRRVESG